MNKKLLSALLVMSMALSLQPTAAYGISGSYTSIDNSLVEFSTFEGSWVLIEAFHSKCGVCQTQHEDISRVYNTYKSVMEVLSLAVILNGNRDTISTLNTFLEDHPSPWLVGIDSTDIYSGTYYISATPTSILFKPDGEIAKVFRGLTSFDDFKDAIDRYVVGTEVPPPVTIDPTNTDPGSALGDFLSNPLVQFGGVLVLAGGFFLTTRGSKTVDTAVTKKKKRSVDDLLNIDDKEE